MESERLLDGGAGDGPVAVDRGAAVPAASLAVAPAPGWDWRAWVRRPPGADLSTATVAAYGLGGIVVAMCNDVVGIFITPFLLEVARMSPLLAGNMLLVAKVGAETGSNEDGITRRARGQQGEQGPRGDSARGSAKRKQQPAPECGPAPPRPAYHRRTRTAPCTGLGPALDLRPVQRPRPFVHSCLQLVDAVTDPMIGTASDATRSRFGRRRPWMAASLPLVMTFTMLLWHRWPALDGNGGAQFAYYLCMLCASTFGMTCYYIPAAALVNTISTKDVDRVRLVAARAGQVIVGTILGVLSFGLISAAFPAEELATGYMIGTNAAKRQKSKKGTVARLTLHAPLDDERPHSRSDECGHRLGRHRRQRRVCARAVQPHGTTTTNARSNACCGRGAGEERARSGRGAGEERAGSGGGAGAGRTRCGLGADAGRARSKPQVREPWYGSTSPDRTCSSVRPCPGH